MTEDLSPPPSSLLKALSEIRKSVGILRKDQRNEAYKFNYVSSTQVLLSVREKMNELGLLLIPRIDRTATEICGKQILTQLWMTFTWYLIDPQESFTIPWYSQGMDTGERGIGKALTYAEKYFILKQFNIPTDEEDPDKHNNQIREEAERPVTPQPKKNTEKPGMVLSRTQPATQPTDQKEPLSEDVMRMLDEKHIDKKLIKVFMVEKKMLHRGNGDFEHMPPEIAKAILGNPDSFLGAFTDWKTKLGLE